MNWKRLSILLLSAVLAAVSLAVAQESADATMDRAKRLYRNGNYRGALEELGKARELEPGSAEALYLTGYSHLMLKEYSESIEAFRRAFEADPSFDPRTIYKKKEPTD